jgi:KDO2-lipid IV(A) lauroyltransferase
LTPTRKSKKPLRHLVEIAALRSVAALARLLGVDLASAAMGFLWRVFARFNKRQARADMHLAIAMPELGAEERAGILSAMWDNLGRTAVETLVARAFLDQPDRIEIADDFRAAVDKAESMGRGIVFCSLHSANWEIGPCATRQLGVPVAAIYKRLSNPYSEDWLRHLRQNLYEGGVLEAGSSSILKLRSMAREGIAIAMLADLPDRTGLRLPFFGRPAMLSSLPVALGRRLGLPVVVCRALRTGGARFRVEGHILELAHTADADADIGAGTVALHATYEAWIRERPSEWMWAIRKWGRNPAPAPLASPEETA